MLPQCIIDKGVENGVAQYMVDKTLKVKDAHVESVKKAYEKGIQIALGTDAGTPFNYHSNTAYEMELLARLDISNMDILKMATINSARCVGVEKDYGSIEVGKQADLVCLNENPLENISNVRKINRVIQSGKIVVDNNLNYRKKVEILKLDFYLFILTDNAAVPCLLNMASAFYI